MTKKTIIILFSLVCCAILIGAFSASPQLSTDEQEVIVQEVITRLNLDQRLADMESTIESNLLAKLSSQQTTQTQAAALAASTTTTTSSQTSYPGLHAKFVNSYAYTVGGDTGKGQTYATEYSPNELFSIDIVFENDGSETWPLRLEVRNTSTNGEYTGHSENFILDKSDDPVLRGGRAGFSFSAHGSENLGVHTFYYQLYDADSGNAIPGGYGWFTYTAR